VSGPRRRAVLLLAATVLLGAGAVVLLTAGVQVRETTGGLLVTPIRQLDLIGGYLVAGTVAGVAAVLTAMSVVPALRRARQASTGVAAASPAGDAAPPPAPDAVPDPDAAPDADPAHVACTPGSDSRE
jgi:hypothetical protein